MKGHVKDDSKDHAYTCLTRTWTGKRGLKTRFYSFVNNDSAYFLCARQRSNTGQMTKIQAARLLTGYPIRHRGQQITKRCC